MKMSRLWLLFGLPLALVACAEDEPEVEPVADPAVVPAEPAMPAPATPAAGMGMEQVVNMTAVNNSGVTGQATVSDATGQTQVMVTLNQLPPNTGHAGHIHMGTCDNIGQVVQPLPEITADATGSGTITETVALDPNTVLNGQHLIAYHQDPGENHGPTIVCGNIPQMNMGAM